MTEREPRLYFPQPLSADERYMLIEDQHRHVSRVLHLKAGSALTLFDGSGGEYPAVVEEMQRTTSTVHTGKHRDVDNESPVHIRLAQGVGRGERTDYAIQKAVELGVTSIVPLLTRRGVVRLDPERACRRLAHWHGIIVHACQQCGRDRIPELCPVVALNDWLCKYERGGLDLILDPGTETSVSAIAFDGGLITLLVGPEGGLDSEEREAAYAAGFRSMTLGPRILRTETAAVAGMTAVQMRWGDLK